MSQVPPTEHWVIDGLEDTPHGTVARVELPGGEVRDIPLSYLPNGVREGDHLEVTAGADGLRVGVRRATTVQARAQAQAKLDTLNSTDMGKEIIL